jgi:hypothetical protein
MNDSLITITFCDRAENHKGMQIIGEAATCTYTYDKLKEMSEEIKNSEFVDISLDDDNEAAILVIREFCVSDEKLFKSLSKLQWDTKALMYGREVNKVARHNLCFADYDQKANIPNGKGTIVNFSHLRYLNKIRRTIVEKLDPGCDLVAEGNYYYNMKKCYIGYHGDAERNIVLGLRLGLSQDLTYCWYQSSNQIGEPINITLNSGDLYIMSDKAVGKDWKKRSIPTLRHGVNTHLSK